MARKGGAVWVVAFTAALTAATAVLVAHQSDPTLWLTVAALAMATWATSVLLVRAVAVHVERSHHGAILGVAAWAGTRRPGVVDVTLSLGTIEPAVTATRIAGTHEQTATRIVVLVKPRDAAAFADHGHIAYRLPGRLGRYIQLTPAEALALGARGAAHPIPGLPVSAMPPDTSTPRAVQP